MSTSDYIGPDPQEFLPLPDPPFLESALIGSSREVALHEAVRMWGYKVGRSGNYHTRADASEWVLAVADGFVEWLEQ